MGKSFSFQCAFILLWVFFFIAVKFCSANYASFANQAFPGLELRFLASINSASTSDNCPFEIMVAKIKTTALMRAIKDLLPPKLQLHCIKLEFEEYISYEENDEGEAKRENGNLGNAASLNHNDVDSARLIKKLFLKKHLQPIPLIFKKPFIQVPPTNPDIQRLSSEPSIPIFEDKPVQMVKRPNFQPIHFFKNLFPTMKKPEHVLSPEFKRPTSKSISFARDSKFIPIPRFIKHIPKPIPFVKKPIPDYEKPMWKPVPEFEKPTSKPTPTTEKPIPEPSPVGRKPTPDFQKPKPISKQIPATDKPIEEPSPAMQKPIPLSKKDLLHPQLAHTIDP